jgi:uncharacterized surface protein with fasciclin (FAS1) repeats
MKAQNTFKLLLLISAISVCIFSCKREIDPGNLNLEATSRSMLSYLKSNPSYSILARALDTTKLSPVLNLYGTMTLFAPTDDAFKKYFDRKKISGLSQMNLDTLATLLKYHLYAQQFESGSFQSGSLPAPTVEGRYIRMDISKGLKNITLNNTVRIDTLNIPVTNGIIHSINDVLEPPTQTLMEWINSKPQYSIMAEAFQKAGIDTALLNKVQYDSSQLVSGKPAIKYSTVFLETNDVLKKYQINSFDDLARRYSRTYNTTKAYSSIADSLNIFLRYHILERKYFVSDIREDYVETFNRGNYLIFTTTPGISINKHNDLKITFNASTGKNDTTYIPSEVKLDFDESNQITRNGIVNSITSLLEVFTPRPVKVVQYIFGAPEDRDITLKDGSRTTFGELWDKVKNDPEGQAPVWWLKSEITTGTVQWVPNYGRVCGDFIMRVNNATSQYWFEVTTKPIFKGTYDVFIVGPGSTGTILTFWDDKPLGGIHDMSNGKNSYGEAAQTFQPCSLQALRAGTVKLTENGVHRLRIQTVTASTSIYWYQIALVPVP